MSGKGLCAASGEKEISEMRKRKIFTLYCVILVMAVSLGLGACKKSQEDFPENEISESLVYSHSMDLKYARQFSVDYYEGGYALVRISREKSDQSDVLGDLEAVDYFLVIPEGYQVPVDLPSYIIPLQQPVENIYLAASAAMDMFVAADALDKIRFSGLKTEGWYIKEAREAMEQGKIRYAGRYGAPDYERIVSEGCGLAIENTMIYHTPQVKEQLERFGIPVMVDYSSYETEPLGRMDWVRLYGLLTGKEESAKKAFESEAAVFEAVSGRENTGKTVAFFYITDNGEVNVRKSSDYLPRMIEQAGGKYVFQNLEDREGDSSSLILQMEEFYAAAKEADYLIYNSAVDGELTTVKELTEKNSLLKEFRAVRDGNVFCTSPNLYQSSMALGRFLSDIHEMLDGRDEKLNYLHRLK